MATYEFGVTDEDMEKFGPDVDICDDLVKRIKKMLLEETHKWEADGCDHSRVMSRIMTAQTILLGDMTFASAKAIMATNDEDGDQVASRRINEIASRLMEGGIGIARLKMDLPVMSPKEEASGNGPN